MANKIVTVTMLKEIRATGDGVEFILKPDEAQRFYFSGDDWINLHRRRPQTLRDMAAIMVMVADAWESGS